MKNYTFNWEIKDLIIQFMAAFDDCIIKRYNEDKEVQAEISVRYVYAPKTRVIHWLVNKQQNITLPVVACSVSSVERDQSRVFNKIDGPIYADSDNQEILQPVPININMDMSILAKYQNDIDQIVSNFVPYNDPYIILSWQHPIIDREIRSEVLWNGNLAYNYPTDIQATEQYRVGIDTSFTIKGWLFKKSSGSAGIIYTVNSNYYGVSGFDILNSTDDYLGYRDSLSGDYFTTTSGAL